MTGVGAYFYIVWCIWLRHCLNGRQDEYELVWPSLFTSVPSCVRRPVMTAKASQTADEKRSEVLPNGTTSKKSR